MVGQSPEGVSLLTGKNGATPLLAAGSDHYMSSDSVGINVKGVAGVRGVRAGAGVGAWARESGRVGAILSWCNRLIATVDQRNRMW
jgi:hypothetical protein